MPVQIPSLWDEMPVNAASPLTILRVQATKLSEATKGVLEAEVMTDVLDDDTVRHRFEVIVPALDGYRRQIFMVGHGRKFPYPCSVVSDFEIRWWDKDGNVWRKWTEKKTSTEGEFMRAVKDILQSQGVREVISSFLAASNDQAEVK